MDKYRAKKRPIKGGSFFGNLFGDEEAKEEEDVPIDPPVIQPPPVAPSLADQPPPAGQPAADQPPPVPPAGPPAVNPPLPPGPDPEPPVASEVNPQLKNNIAKIAKTVIDSILTSKNLELEKKYADFINKNGTYKPGRDLNTDELIEEVGTIIAQVGDRIENIRNKIIELESLRETIVKNLDDTGSILETDRENNPLDLNNPEQKRLGDAGIEFDRKIKVIDEQLEKLRRQLQLEQQIIEDAENIKEDAKKKFKINFNIGLKNSDIAVNLYYEKPKIIIEPVIEQELIDTISSDPNEYIAFKKLDELGTKFIEEFNTLKNTKDLDFSDTLHVLKSKYVKFTGGSNYDLIIDFDIYIYLKIDDIEDSPTKGKIIVDNFYFHINADEVKGIIDPNLDTTDEEYQNMQNAGINALPADGILDYDLNVNGLDSNMQTNIIKYLEEMDNPAIVENIQQEQQPVVGGRPNRRTRKKKKSKKKRKYSNKKKSRVKRKTRQ